MPVKFKQKRQLRISLLNKYWIPLKIYKSEHTSLQVVYKNKLFRVEFSFQRSTPVTVFQISTFYDSDSY